MNEEQKQLFDAAAKPLMDYLLSQHHPHTSVIVTASTAELVEGLRTSVLPIDREP